MSVSNTGVRASVLKKSTDVGAGFITKIKKLLEAVCHNCGKILVDEVSHAYWDG